MLHQSIPKLTHNYIENQIKDEIQILLNIKPKFNKHILVLSGGGMKGIAHIGALKKLEELGHLNKFKVFAGTSIGALISAMYIIGYSPSEMLNKVSDFKIEQLKSVPKTHFNNTNQKMFGIDDNNKISIFIKDLIINKNFTGNVTLYELYKKTNKKLIITTVCLNDNNPSVHYLSYDSHPNLSVVDAITMSICIPYLFTPIKHTILYDKVINNKSSFTIKFDQIDEYYSDGGLYDNYPIKFFENDIEHVLGIYLVNNNNTGLLCQSSNKSLGEDHKFIFKQGLNLIGTFIEKLMGGMDFNAIKGYEKYTLCINLNNINSINFDIDATKKKEIFDSGYNSCHDYFK